MPTRTLLIDDHRLFNDGLSLVLRETTDFVVVGQVYDSRGAVEACARHTPDLVLVDYNMPHLDGLAVVQAVRALPRPCRIVVISMYAEPREIARFAALKVDGYIAKTIAADHLLTLLRAVMTGRIVVETGADAQPAPNPAPLPADAFRLRHGLTTREIEVLKRVRAGLTTEQIAAELNLSYFTVQTHRKNASRKLPFTNQRDFYDFLDTLD